MQPEKMTAAEYNQLVSNETRRTNKFKAKRVKIDGIWFDSKKEGRRYVYLTHLLNSGEIKDLELQHAIMLTSGGVAVKTAKGRQMRLTVDFKYYCMRRGRLVYEDVKGKRTRDYEVRKACAEAMGYTIDET